MLRRTLAALFVCASSTAGCEGEARPEAQVDASRRVVSEPVITEPRPPARPRKPKKGISAMAVQQADALAKRFRAPQGTPLCDTEALARLQILRAQHGTPRPIKTALLAAYDACNERVALAELLRETLPDSPSDDELMALGRAWVEAVRFEEAAEVLAPLAKRLGPDSPAAWTHAMALAYLGQAELALPQLRTARAHAGGPSGVDAHTLIALCLLELDRVDEAIPELEAGLELAPNHPPMLTLASRAYTAAGRSDDAVAAADRARQAHAQLNELEQSRARAESQRRTLNAAWQAERFEEVESLIDEMWPSASPAERIRLLKNRAALYDRTGRPSRAKAARRELEGLMKALAQP